MKIVIDMPDVYPAGINALKLIPNVEVHCITSAEPNLKPRPVAPDEICDAEILFCTFPPANLAEMRALRWVQLAGVGYEQLLGLGLSERGIKVVNCRGCLDIPIAEWNMTMMVCLARDFRQLMHNQDLQKWDRSAVFQREIRGLTVGFWGYGGIGRETARIARHNGLRVHVLTRSGMIKPRLNTYLVAGTGDPGGILPERVYSATEKMSFLGGLDFLVISVPLTNVTRGLIGEAELKGLRRSAYLLNPARGPIVQEGALIQALQENWIAGAALDTHYHYPLPPQHALWHLPNVIITPHISGSALSTHYEKRMWDLFVQNIQRDAAGASLLNELTSIELAGE